MPTVLRIGPYRFHFYSDEGTEPAHVHVRSPSGECKFWLDPAVLAGNGGLPPTTFGISNSSSSNTKRC